MVFRTTPTNTPQITSLRTPRTTPDRQIHPRPRTGTPLPVRTHLRSRITLRSAQTHQPGTHPRPTLRTHHPRRNSAQTRPVSHPPGTRRSTSCRCPVPDPRQRCPQLIRHASESLAGRIQFVDLHGFNLSKPDRQPLNRSGFAVASHAPSLPTMMPTAPPGVNRSSARSSNATCPSSACESMPPPCALLDHAGTSPRTNLERLRTRSLHVPVR